MALTKADLAENLFNELGLNKREAKEFVEIFFEKIREALEKGQQVNRRKGKEHQGHPLADASHQ